MSTPGAEKRQEPRRQALREAGLGRSRAPSRWRRRRAARREPPRSGRSSVRCGRGRAGRASARDAPRLRQPPGRAPQPPGERHRPDHDDEGDDRVAEPAVAVAAGVDLLLLAEARGRVVAVPETRRPARGAPRYEPEGLLALVLIVVFRLLPVWRSGTRLLPDLAGDASRARLASLRSGPTPGRLSLTALRAGALLVALLTVLVLVRPALVAIVHLRHWCPPLESRAVRSPARRTKSLQHSCPGARADKRATILTKGHAYG